MLYIEYVVKKSAFSGQKQGWSEDSHLANCSHFLDR